MDDDYTRHMEKMKLLLQAREAAFEILGVYWFSVNWTNPSRG